MKKHLLGLAVFSFIVVSFAVAFAFLYAPKPRKVEEIRTPVFETGKRSCFYNKSRYIENTSIKIKNATLTEKNREFNAVIESGDLSEETEVKLHFFVNDGKKIEYLTTKNSQALRNYNIDRPTAYVRLKLDESKQLFSKKNNFYVILETKGDNSKSAKNHPTFDSNKAIPILWIVDAISD